MKTASGGNPNREIPFHANIVRMIRLTGAATSDTIARNEIRDVGSDLSDFAG